MPTPVGSMSGEGGTGVVVVVVVDAAWIMRVAVADWTLPAAVPVTVSVYGPGLAVDVDRSRLSVDVKGGVPDWVVKLLRTSPGKPITLNETGTGLPATGMTDTT
jgi:hypothetical protein